MDVAVPKGGKERPRAQLHNLGTGFVRGRQVIARKYNPAALFDQVLKNGPLWITG